MKKLIFFIALLALTTAKLRGGSHDYKWKKTHLSEKFQELGLKLGGEHDYDWRS